MPCLRNSTPSLLASTSTMKRSAVPSTRIMRPARASPTRLPDSWAGTAWRLCCRFHAANGSRSSLLLCGSGHRPPPRQYLTIPHRHSRIFPPAGLHHRRQIHVQRQKGLAPHPRAPNAPKSVPLLSIQVFFISPGRSDGTTPFLASLPSPPRSQRKGGIKRPSAARCAELITHFIDDSTSKSPT
jgi:hypothetical protein